MREAISEPPGDYGFGEKFEVDVIFTTWPGTQAALYAVREWTRYLDARVVLWSPQVVPRRFSMTAPPVSTGFIEHSLQRLAEVCCDGMEVVIRVCLCREQHDCLLSVLSPQSIVLVGGKVRWWHTQEQRLAGFLHSAGLRVLFIPVKERAPVTLAAPEWMPT
ncbi:MAG TPA: hypothetical protein VNI35_07860 [Nitrospira sp.]|nr:hypothetical protein [Nitrospira sp.]